MTPSYKKIQVKKTFQEKEKKFLSDNFFFTENLEKKKWGTFYFLLKKSLSLFHIRRKKNLTTVFPPEFFLFREKTVPPGEKLF